MTTQVEVDQVLGDALSYLTGETARRGQVSVENAVNVVRGVATENGLEPDCIKDLMNFVTGAVGTGRISERSCIVRCLVPRTTVPVSALFHALGSMQTLPLSFQHLLFRWMILIFDLIDDPERFQALYDIIFQYLGYDELRPTVCQLLCYMTRRYHVKEFRVQQLLDICKCVVVQKDSSESSLMALLSIYKLHCPHLLPMASPPARKVWFRPFEKDLASNISRIQRKRSKTDDRSMISANWFLNYIRTAPPQPSRKRRNLSSIPTLLTSSVPSETDAGVKWPVATITSVQELCENIDRLELPGRMGAVLESSLLQHVFSIWPDHSVVLRFTYWIQHSLGTELDNYSPGLPESPHLLNMLKCCANLTEFLMEPIPTMEMFLLIILESWNGKDYRKQIFKLLGYLSLQSFDDLEYNYLDSLKELFMQKDLWFRYSLISSLTDLLSFWASLEWPCYRKRVEGGFQEGEVDKLRLRVFTESIWNKELPPDFDCEDSIKLLVKHVENLLLVALEKDNGHILIKHGAATFYELVTRLPKDYAIPLLFVPHPQIVNQMMLSSDLMALSRILSSYVRCKATLSAIEKPRRDLVTITTFNSVVLDICDSLWRDLAFSSSSRPYQTHLFTTDREYLSSYQLQTIHNKFSIIHHPAFLGFVKEFFRETQDQNYNVFQPAAIWKEKRFKDTYLEYLHKKNLTGLVSFIQTFIQRT